MSPKTVRPPLEGHAGRKVIERTEYWIFWRRRRGVRRYLSGGQSVVTAGAASGRPGVRRYPSKWSLSGPTKWRVRSSAFTCDGDRSSEEIQTRRRRHRAAFERCGRRHAPRCHCWWSDCRRRRRRSPIVRPMMNCRNKRRRRRLGLIDLRRLYTSSHWDSYGRRSLTDERCAEMRWNQPQQLIIHNSFCHNNIAVQTRPRLLHGGFKQCHRQGG